MDDRRVEDRRKEWWETSPDKNIAGTVACAEDYLARMRRRGPRRGVDQIVRELGMVNDAERNN